MSDEAEDVLRSSSDLRLLIRLDEKIDGLVKNVDDIKRDIANKADLYRVEKLEELGDKLDIRVSRVEMRLYLLIGGLVVIESLIKILWGK